ncbi:MAG: hypothetical protein WC935_06750 [Thermoleophilia bacterium]
MRRELGTDVAMVHGRYGEFKVLVDENTIVDGGALAFLGIMPSAQQIVEVTREALRPQPPEPNTR